MSSFLLKNKAIAAKQEKANEESVKETNGEVKEDGKKKEWKKLSQKKKDEIENQENKLRADRNVFRTQKGESLREHEARKNGKEIITLYEMGVCQQTPVECFPKNIAPIELSYGTNDTISTVDITFTYRYWTNVATQQLNSGSSITDRLSEIAVNTIERKITSQLPQILRKL